MNIDYKIAKLYLHKISKCDNYRLDNTITDISSSFNFTTVSIPHSQTTDMLSSQSVTPNNITLYTDSDKTYKATLNIFSTNVETYTGTVNTSTSVGPIGFDCYDVSTSASNANFSNQLTFVQSNGSSFPNWMTFDSTTASVTLSIPNEESSDTYTITNSYTGVLGSTFTLTTNATISITNATNSDDDYCLKASSEGMCAFFVILIVVGVLAPFIFVFALIYCKYKCKRSRQDDISKIEQEQPGEDIQQNQESDEFFTLGQQNEMVKTETQRANQDYEVESNQV